MSYLDGVHYSTDQISGQDYIPLTYTAASWGGRHTLDAKNETMRQPQIKFKDHPVVLDKPLVKKETMVSSISSDEFFGISHENIIIILFVIFVIILAMQINIHMKLERLQMFNMFNMSKMSMLPSTTT